MNEMLEPAPTPAAQWKPGDRIWLLPDGDRREVKSRQPGLIAKALDSGRLRVVYMDQGCLLTKTVEAKRVISRELDIVEDKRMNRKVDKP